MVFELYAVGCYPVLKRYMSSHIYSDYCEECL